MRNDRNSRNSPDHRQGPARNRLDRCLRILARTEACRAGRGFPGGADPTMDTPVWRQSPASQHGRSGACGPIRTNRPLILHKQSGGSKRSWGVAAASCSVADRSVENLLRQGPRPIQYSPAAAFWRASQRHNVAEFPGCGLPGTVGIRANGRRVAYGSAGRPAPRDPVASARRDGIEASIHFFKVRIS
jgi:hypothetical protein